MWVTVDGGELSVQTAGRGAPILLVHGWPLDHRVFQPQVEYFARCFNTITYDRRGFGRSRAPAGLGRELDDIDRIREALGLDRIHLLGMSQGGRIALRYAVTRPSCIRTLLLQGAVVDGFDVPESESERIPLDEFSRLVRKGNIEEVRRRWLAHPLMSVGEKHVEARQLLASIMAGYSGNDLRGPSDDRFAFAHDVLRALPDFPAPALILTGATETGARRIHARKLLELIPDSREFVFEHSGHLCNLTEPELYNERVADFCRRADVRQDALGSGALY